MRPTGGTNGGEVNGGLLDTCYTCQPVSQLVQVSWVVPKCSFPSFEKGLTFLET